jgi:hypothetical protein
VQPIKRQLNRNDDQGQAICKHLEINCESTQMVTMSPVNPASIIAPEHPISRTTENGFWNEA